MFRYPALFAFILALLIRLGYTYFVQTIHPDSIYQTDSWGYLNIAMNLFEGRDFSQMLIPPYTPDSTRTPLYPGFIALFHVLKLKGYWIVYSQAFMGGLIAWFTVKSAQLIDRKNPANVFAGIIVALNLPSIFLGNVVATETLFTLLLVIAMYYAIKGIRFREEQAVHFSILFLALATLCRPISFYFTLLAPLLYFLTSGFAITTRIKTFIVQLLIIGICVGPWIYRNHSTFGSPFFSSISEVNLLFHTSSQLRSSLENRTQKSVEMEYRNEYLNHLDFVNEPTVMPEFIAFARAESKRVISENPKAFAKMWGVSSFMFFAKPMRSYFNMQLKGDASYQAITSVEARSKGSVLQRTLDQTDRLTLLLVVAQLFFLALIYLGIIFSLKFWWSGNKLIFLVLSGLVIYMAAASSLTEVDARFRTPIIPVLALLCIPAYRYIFKKISGNVIYE